MTDQLEQLYKEAILELHRHPLNKKDIPDAHFRHKEFNPSCGDEIELTINCDTAQRIIDIGHTGQGCAISQAAVSLLTERVKGKMMSEIQEMTESDMLTLLPVNIPQTRINCALLGFYALKKIF
jgi:nitrogen fixation NifU-like protein